MTVASVFKVYSMDGTKNLIRMGQRNILAIFRRTDGLWELGLVGKVRNLCVRF